MKNKLPSGKCDFITAIDLPQSILAEKLSASLESHYRITTKEVAPQTFLSTSATRSFLSAFILAVPAEIAWSIGSDHGERAKLKASFNVPLWLKAWIYGCIVAIGLMYHVSNPIFSPLAAEATMLCLVLNLISLVLILGMLFGVVNLLIRYQSFMNNLLKNIVNPERSQAIQIKNIHLKQSLKMTTEWPMLGVILLVFLFPLVIFPQRTAEVLLPTIILLSVALPLLFWAWKTSKAFQKGNVKAGKLFAVLCNVYMSAIVSTALLLGPLTQMVMTNNLIRDAKEATYISHSLDEISGLFSTDNSSSARSDFTIDARIFRKFSIALLIMQLTWIFVILSIVLAATPTLELAIGGSTSIHQQSLENTINKMERADDKSIEMSLGTKIIIGLAFVIFTTCNWFGVLVNASLIFAITTPLGEWVGFPISHALVDGTLVMAYAWLGEDASLTQLNLFRLLLLLPLLFPFLSFVLLQIRALFLQRRNHQAASDVNSSISKKANDIAQWMGINPIRCMIVQDNPSPYADIRGIIPVNILAYPSIFQLFVDFYPHHAEAVIAHELTHIKFHAQKNRYLRILSRFSLSGTGFLSILTNTIKNESEADNFARQYLSEHNLDEKLLDEAIDKLAAINYVLNNIDNINSTNASPFIQAIASKIKHTSVEINSIWQKVINSLKVFCTFYFDVEIYDYLHRQDRFRITDEYGKKLLTTL